jgi:hypothetical protein
MTSTASGEVTTGDQRVSMWQPIETAPKDGSWILAYRSPPKNGGVCDTLVAVRWFDDGEIRDFIWPDREPRDPFTADADDETWIEQNDFYESGGTFTHWMPLPEPPTEDHQS